MSLGIRKSQKDSAGFSGIQKFHVFADAVGSRRINGTDDQRITCLGNIFFSMSNTYLETAEFFSVINAMVCL